MSSRIVPLTALSVMLLVIFWAVVATAQQPGAAPVGGQFLPIQPGDVQPGVPPQQPLQQYGQPQFAQQVPAVQPGTVQPGAGQPGDMQAGLPQPVAPIQLNPQEQQFVDRVLDDWQAVSARVKTLEADFTLYEYNGVFGEADKPTRQTTGKVRYAAPDKGHYETDDGIDKWVCTGTAIFEFNKKLQKVREYPIPPQMQGQAIADGPMPFVFGVEKTKMKNRYWLKVNMSPEAVAKQQVWLEAYPKLAKDAANFQKIDVILQFTLNPDGSIADLQPYALNLIRPTGKDRSAYIFGNVKSNGLTAGIRDWFNWFVRPNTPSGWTHELSDLDAPVEQPGPGQIPGGTAPPPRAGGIGSAPQPVVPR